MEYHVFKKPKKLKNGKAVRRWYYYFVDKNGKEIQKSCGKFVKNRSDAESFVRELPGWGPGNAESVRVLVKTIAENMYIPGSDHYKRRKELGRSTDMDTMKEARGLIRKIITDFGEICIDDLTVIMVTKRLLKMNCSGSRKNRYIQVLGEIYQEAPWHHSKVTPPKFPTFARNVRKADIFSTSELNRLFLPENFPSETMFLFFLCCLSAGLRLSEVRGIRRKQIIFDRKVLIVDGYCKQNGTRTVYNKKGTPDNPKFRIVFLSDLTLEKLRYYLDQHSDLQPEDYIFYREAGKPLRTEYAEAIFDKALLNAGLATDLKKHNREIQAAIKKGEAPPSPIMIRETDYKKQDIFIIDGRKLVPHSLRYTYVSRMSRELSAVELQPMTGHTSVQMIDYYNRKILDEAIAASPRAEAAANNLFI
ncbi:MAG: site-specific integrase [Treponema sp.]|jgi:integrase|nr:site-specific integrase [Treponema sp.]